MRAGGTRRFQNTVEYAIFVLYAYTSFRLRLYIRCICIYNSPMAAPLPCYCATLRRAARVISQKYDAALRDLQLTITQLTLLTALHELPLARSNDLVEALAIYQTTLSRTLKAMED